VTDLTQHAAVEFVLAEEPIYVGKVAGDSSDHTIGQLHHSTSVHVEHYGDRWVTTLADGQVLALDCHGPAAIKPVAYDCFDMLTWRLFDGVPQVVNLVGTPFTPGDSDNWMDGGPAPVKEQPSASPFWWVSL
jgi:hypothetical protein